MLSSAPLPVICRIAKKYNPNAATITTDNSNNINPPISGREQRKSQISTGVMNASSREVGLLPRSTVRTPMMSFSLESMIDPTSSHDLLHTSKSWSSALSSPSSTVVKPDGDDLHVVVGESNNQ